MSIEVCKWNRYLNVSYKPWLRLGLDYFNLLILYLDSLGGHNIAQEANLILIEPTFLQIGKKTMFPEVFEYSTNGFFMS